MHAGRKRLANFNLPNQHETLSIFADWEKYRSKGQFAFGRVWDFQLIIATCFFRKGASPLQPLCVKSRKQPVCFALSRQSRCRLFAKSASVLCWCLCQNSHANNNAMVTRCADSSVCRLLEKRVGAMWAHIYPMVRMYVGLLLPDISLVFFQAGPWQGVSSRYWSLSKL